MTPAKINVTAHNYVSPYAKPVDLAPVAASRLTVIRLFFMAPDFGAALYTACQDLTMSEPVVPVDSIPIDQR